jgi:epoxyqueuosine reductase
MKGETNSAFIKNKALSLGFDACGIAEVKFLSNEYNYLIKWLQEKKNGNLEYLTANIEQKTDPSKIDPSYKSVIGVLQSYANTATQHPQAFYKITKYAYGRDYHALLKEKLSFLSEEIKKEFPDAVMQVCVDSNLLLEKAWALQCGLGWRGKNSLLLNKDLGSFVFIGLILTDLELEQDELVPDYCGSCNKCREACPVDALEDAYQLNASKCISRITIERSDETDADKKTFGWIYGCDLCQDVCPRNKNKPLKKSVFEPNPELLNMTKNDWDTLDKPTFKKLFKDSAMRRVGFEKLKSNMINAVK